MEQDCTAIIGMRITKVEKRIDEQWILIAILLFKATMIFLINIIFSPYDLQIINNQIISRTAPAF
jgi:hypothetical protein